MKRIPIKPVADWPRKQLWRYAYDALEREYVGYDRHGQEFTELLKDQLSRDELIRWASHEVEYRQLGGGL